MAALARQLADGPGLGLPLYQQPAAGKERRGAIGTNMKGDAAAILRAQSTRPQTPGRYPGSLAHQPTEMLDGRQGEQLPGVGGGDALERQQIEQVPGHREHDGMQARLGILNQQQRACVPVQLYGPLGF